MYLLFLYFDKLCSRHKEEMLKKNEKKFSEIKSETKRETNNKKENKKTYVPLLVTENNFS